MKKVSSDIVIIMIFMVVHFRGENTTKSDVSVNFCRGQSYCIKDEKIYGVSEED